MVQKLIVRLTMLVLVFLTGLTQVSAQDRVAGSSAAIIKQSVDDVSIDTGYRSQKDYARAYAAIRRVLKSRNSPLTESTPSFVKNCIDRELDCYLLPAITGLESSFGHAIHPGSNNPFGWGGGYISFNTWDDAIDTVAEGLEKNYIGRGAVTIEQIGRRYAASPTWAPRVRAFMDQFRAAESTGLISGEFGLEL